MKRLARTALDLHRCLLHLYPPQFRAEFADEMGEVFNQGIQESKDNLSLVSLMAGELKDLPFNLLREHARERRANALTLLIEEKIMTNNVIPMRAFRGMTWTLITIFVLYCLLILLPYFAAQLNMMSPDALISGSYDPKGYPPFIYGTVGDLFYLVGLAIILFGLPTVAATGGVLALTLRRHWRQFQHKQRLWGSMAVMAAVFIVGIAVSPFGRALTVWFFD